MPDNPRDEDLFFPSEPTARGDQIASYVRQWYEKNRESWWTRLGQDSDRSGTHADEFMLGFIQEVNRIQDAASRTVEIVEMWKQQDKKKSAVPEKKKFKTKRKVTIKHDPT